jgi:peptide chain release factor 3
VLRRSDGSYLALFPDKWRAHTVARDHPDLLLEALPAGTG